MSIMLLTDYHLEFLSKKKETIQAHLSLHLSKCHIVGNHMSNGMCAKRKLASALKSTQSKWSLHCPPSDAVNSTHKTHSKTFDEVLVFQQLEKLCMLRTIVMICRS